jgi:tetratricopeptide (TPR) repeat protein
LKSKILFSFILVLILVHSSFSTNLDEGILLYKKGEFRQGVEHLQKLTIVSPDEPDARLWLGKAYLKTREWDKAVHEIEKAVQLRPANARYYLWLGRACGGKAAHTLFVKAFEWARRVVKEFEMARSLAPKDLDIRFDLLEFYLEAPSIVGGGKSKAEEEAQEIARLNPSKGYTARAIIFQKNKKWDFAKNEFTQATIDYPNADSYRDLAEYLFNQKDYEGALGCASKSLKLDGDSKGARLLAAASSIRLHSNIEYASKTLQELAEGTLDDDDPTFEEVYYWRGECFLEKIDKENARKAFQTALRYNPDYDEAKKSISKLK